MFQNFFGLTAVNIVMSNMPTKLFIDCVEQLKDDKATMTLLNMQFDKMEEFLNSIPTEYSNIEAKRAYGKMLRLKKVDPSNEQIKELESFLSKQEITVASFVDVGVGENSKRIYLSELSKKIIVYLKSRQNSIARYRKYAITNSNVEKEVIFFNAQLYSLRNFSRGRLIRLLSNLQKTYNKGTPSVEFWEFVKSFTDFILEHVNDSSVDESIDESSDTLAEVNDFINNITVDYLNTVLDVEYDLEDYHKASLELFNVGLVGFTPFVEELFNEFKKSFRHNYDNEVYVSTSSDIYKFTVELRRALDSNLVEGDPVGELPNKIS